ncbi:DUF6043 family protein [Chryseobacterium sp. 3008163]|uniref:DUF6043 family protein n=1 Tax=Chryseobacterium sp. 3008163 TaxID=2478663 RepID=UPI000F0D1436|nr:DUF6043 family protein [Chryseobacterium sp. 3008163]AYN01854.1 hypothetical protein EAG08_17550 [Chryseobacterium sp. 3008163]
MNRKDNAGYDKIFQMATSIIPKYKSAISRKLNQGSFDDISDFNILFSENNVAEYLVSNFQNIPKNSIIPAMLAWLYFGKSFERMVERGLEMRKKQTLNYVEKQFIVSIMKQVIEFSISSGLRIKSDWENHFQQLQLADGNNLENWLIQDSITEKKNVGRKPDTQELPQHLLEKIGKYLENNKSENHLAYLKIALEELKFSKPKGIKAFREILNKKYGNIISERGIQSAYKTLTDTMSNGEFQKDLKQHRPFIDQLKEMLSN